MMVVGFVDIHPKEKVSAAELVYTKLHAGGNLTRKEEPIRFPMLHGVGAAVVNALSKYVHLEVKNMVSFTE